MIEPEDDFLVEDVARIMQFNEDAYQQLSMRQKLLIIQTLHNFVIGKYEDLLKE